MLLDAPGRMSRLFAHSRVRAFQGRRQVPEPSQDAVDLHPSPSLIGGDSGVLMTNSFARVMGCSSSNAYGPLASVAAILFTARLSFSELCFCCTSHVSAEIAGEWRRASTASPASP